ncbi:MAG: hypothetical protein PHR06_03015 [Candidatus Cloacimonetes bacterium]|nr:hypothetical protein [Candidatus Cloacimonadota bacterium]
MFKAETYERLLEITRIMQRAVEKVQKKHLKNGIPNVYSKNGKTVWELPDGSYTNIDPFKKTEKEN